MAKFKNMNPKHTMRIIYNALNQSNFQYGIFIWDSLRDNILNALIINQNNCQNLFKLYSQRIYE